MLHIFRTRFGKDIVSEFLPPHKKSSRVIILFSGMPSRPGNPEVMKFFSKKGYWVFAPRYRGAWESGGKFLRYSPEKDVRDVINGLSKGFLDLWSRKRYKLNFSKLIVVGSSFGGPAAILSLRDPRVAKAIAISPVVDWKMQAKSKGEPWLPFLRFIADGFGSAYRIVPGGWQKLKRGGFYDPIHFVDEIDGKRLLIIHAKDDDIVSWRSVAQFAKKSKANFLLLKQGGHLGQSYVLKPHALKHIKAFIDK